MDSYIVRIYQRETGPHHKLLGIVAGMGGAADLPFSSADEVWLILTNRQGLSDGCENDESSDDLYECED